MGQFIMGFLMLQDYKFWLASIAVCLTIFAYIPYVKGILDGKVKPHLFTWIVWLIVPVIAVAAQIVEGGGMGAWPTLVAVLICVLIVGLSIKRGSKDIKPIDYVFLAASLSAIPLWVVMDEPAWSATLVTIVQLLAAFPTIRKSWSYPEQEAMSTYGINTIRYMLTILALASLSVATMVYPLGMILMNGVIFSILFFRRKVITRPELPVM